MGEQVAVVRLGGHEWTISRARLGGYVRLQKERENLVKGVEEGDNGKIVGAIFEFLRVCIPELTQDTFFNAPWFEAVVAYQQIDTLNRLPFAEEFAIIRYAKGDGKPVPWDNPLRTVLIWIHLIAKTYSWTKEAIENLFPEEAVAFVQEIIADEQTAREFIHSLSDVAYEYNRTTKKSHYRPLQRPAWMALSKPKKIRTLLRRDMLPVGNVIYPENVDEVLLLDE